MTPAPAPLPPEEIERLEFLVKHGNGNGVAVVTIATISSLLAEIEAGRAGAERVRALEDLLRSIWESDNAGVIHIGWRYSSQVDAALRQAAQPSDGAQSSCSANDWRHGACTHSAPYHGHCPKCGVPLPATPAAPAQVGAQPTGRVTTRAEQFERYRQAVCDVNRMRDDGTLPDVTPPTAGAVDDGGNGR